MLHALHIRLNSFLLVPVLLLAGVAILLVSLNTTNVVRAGNSIDGTLGGMPEPLPAGVYTETVLNDLTGFPLAMEFDLSGRLFFIERLTGDVRLYADGILQVAPVFHVDTENTVEQGLLGLALDPDFEANHYVYIFWSCGSSGGCNPSSSRVTRFQENMGVGTNPVVVWSTQLVGTQHVGGNIHFGPDRKLYITVGDNSIPANSQDVTSKFGKIHRINADGTIPADNPVFTQTGAIPGLYTMGLRNSFDFDFDPIFTPGPYPRIFSGENGPGCDDELNRIEARYNYGWRNNYPCDDSSPDPMFNTIPPLWYEPSMACCDAPVDTTFYRGSQISEWNNELFLSFVGGGVAHFHLSPDHLSITGIGILNQFITAPGSEIETGPDGSIWYFERYNDNRSLVRMGGSGPTSTPRPTGTSTSTETSTPTAPTSTVTPIVTNTSTSVPPSSTATPSPGSTQTTASTETVTPISTNTTVVTSTLTPAANTPTSTVEATSTTCAVVFSDVPAGSTFYTYIRCLACRGLVNGYADGTFRPNNSVTRGQLVKIVANAAGFGEPVSGQMFEDVQIGSTFYEYVGRMATRGYINGYACGGAGEPCNGPENRPYFRVNGNSTRGQIAKVVANAAGLQEPAGQQVFEDVVPNSTFFDFVQRLANLGVMGGYACGGPGEPCVGPGNRPYFRPGTNASRGQSAKIVANTFFPNCDPPSADIK